MTDKYKILIAEDHEHTRKSLAFALNTIPYVQYVVEVEDGRQAVDYVKFNRVDIVLMDIAMPVLSGIDAAKEIRDYDPNIKVLMLTSMIDKDNVLNSFKSGASAYCTKNVKTKELASIIQAVMEGAVWIDPVIACFVLEILRAENGDSNSQNQQGFNLTVREKEILKLISEGKSNKIIAEELFLSMHTVKNHVKSIIQKLAVDDRTQAAIMAIKQNII